MLHSLREKGRMVVVLDTGAVSRGSGSAGTNRERNIRKSFVEADLVEAVILLPENLFYNTPSPGIVMVINKAKLHPREILLVNASKQFAKGRPKNFLTEEHIAAVAGAHEKWESQEALSAVITLDDAATNDFNLSPSRYVAVDGQAEVLPVEDAIVLLAEAEEERQRADLALKVVLEGLGVDSPSPISAER